LIKLLIVEDESSTRKGLIKHIKWDELGIGLVKEARDGIEGLEIAGSMEPDIIISDIRMPRMNGIEFCAHIREQFPECKIILLSAYSDKAYLKSAIHLNVVNYVEKPINIEEFRNSLKKAVDLCVENEKKKQTEKNISTALYDTLPFIRQNIVHNLVGKNVLSEEIVKDIKIAGVPFNVNDFYKVSIISPLYINEQSNQTKQTCCNEIISFLEKCPGDLNHIAAIKDFDHIIIISCCKFDIKNSALISVYQSLKYHLGQDLTVYKDLFWAVGQTSFGMSCIRDSYVTALTEFEKLFFLGYGKIVFFNDRPESEFSINKGILSDFSGLLQNLQKDKLTEFIENLYINISTHIGTPINEIKNVFFQMTSLLFKEGEVRGLQLSNVQGKEEKYLWVIISKFQTLQELKDYLLEQIDKILQGIEDIESNSRAILEVMNFIKENYKKPYLSVKLLADHVYLTPTYLSSLFKKETGKTISEYLTEIRIEKSLDLLMKPHAKLHEVAEKIGYSDPNYYAKNFKKLKGLTPSQFRRKYKS
jgi:two-component system, response regulator YesN